MRRNINRKESERREATYETKCKWEKNTKINFREIGRRLDLSGPDEHSNCRTRAKKDWTVVDSLNDHEFLKAKCFQRT
jgi:hypothetical protein